MSDLHDRFDRLARRGTLRGADAVLAEASRQADDSGAIAGVDAEPTTLDDARGVSPINLEAASSGRRNRRLGSLVTAGGVAASLFVGVLAVGSLTGGGGGSNSPEGAVRQLADAVAHEDALAAADVLAPEEVRSLKGTVDAAFKRAQELALAESASAPLAGLDLSVDGLDLTTESLADGYAKVTVAGGSISARTDKSNFSPLMQRTLRNSENSEARGNLAKLGESEDLPTFVMTVQRDGNWYVSAAYTALEYIRVANDLPAAEFGSGKRVAATLGADSPDAAVTEAMHALAGNDWQKLISLAAPAELPVYDYRAALTEATADWPTNFTIDEIDTASTVFGDTAKVALTATGRTDNATWSLDGSCFEQHEDGDERTLSTCGSRALSIVPFTFGLYGEGISGGSEQAITAVRKDGRWFVSPVGTVLDVVDQAISNLTRRTLYTLLNVPDLLPPDGTLVLGEPVSLPATEFGARVYTFEGRQGQRLLGLATHEDIDQFGFSTDGRIFAADGTELDDSYGLLRGQAVELPADGKYIVTFMSYDVKDASVTIWEEADAPEAAKNPSFPDSSGECTSTIGVGMTCSDSDSGSTTETTFTDSSSAPTSTIPGG